MLAEALWICIMLVMTALTGFVYLRWDALPRREHYTAGDKSIALLTFVFALVATIVVLYIAFTR